MVISVSSETESFQHHLLQVSLIAIPFIDL